MAFSHSVRKIGAKKKQNSYEDSNQQKTHLNSLTQMCHKKHT